MSQRINNFKVAPKAMEIMLDFEKYAKTTDFDPKLIELIKMRASQINGCAYCLDMHTKDARAIGESEERIYLLPLWRDTNLFTAEEQVTLELTEVITKIIDNEVSDELYTRAREHFNEK